MKHMRNLANKIIYRKNSSTSLCVALLLFARVKINTGKEHDKKQLYKVQKEKLEIGLDLVRSRLRLRFKLMI